MQLLKFAALLTTVVLTNARDATKLMKTVPTISNSLVNLGKMEISIHFNGKHQEAPPAADQNLHLDYYSQPAMEESCPCNNFKRQPFLSDPSDIINKILKSNDLFKNPTSSVCCDSSEHIRESTVVFEVNPSNSDLLPPKPPSSIQALPNILRGPVFSPFIPINPVNNKPKTVEIFMLPTKKNNNMSFDVRNLLKQRKTKASTIMHSDLQLIKDGSQQPSASVKKDLNVSEKKAEIIVAPKDELQTDAPPITPVLNSL